MNDPRDVADNCVHEDRGIRRAGGPGTTMRRCSLSVPSSRRLLRAFIQDASLADGRPTRLCTGPRWQLKVPPGWEMPASPMVSAQDPRAVTIYSGAMSPGFLGTADVRKLQFRGISTCGPV